MILLLVSLLLFLAESVQASVICYECHANSTDQGKFCSIDKLCRATGSCYFELKSNNSWSAGCSATLTANSNITCSASGTSSSCSCNADFCNSFAKSEAALKLLSTSGTTGSWGSWWGTKNSTKAPNVTLALPDRSMIHCEECGSVQVGNDTVKIPCDHNHTCQGNYCVSIRGQSPYSYCGGVWDVEKAPACYLKGDDPEMCICSMHMCNELLEPAPLMTTTVALGDPTLATIAPIRSETDAVPTLATTKAPTQAPTTTGTTATTAKPTTKRKCKTNKLSPNDQAVFMGEKLKNVIMGGFGSDDGAVQDFEDDINDHICNYSDDEETE